MLSTGILQLFKMKAEEALAPPGVYGTTHLGYPVYLLAHSVSGKFREQLLCTFQNFLY